jgi:hypothetical protein
MEGNGKVPELPAAQDNAGNLFKQLGPNIYTESLEQLKREGKVSVKNFRSGQEGYLQFLFATYASSVSCATYFRCYLPACGF